MGYKIFLEKKRDYQKMKKENFKERDFLVVGGNGLAL